MIYKTKEIFEMRKIDEEKIDMSNVMNKLFEGDCLNIWTRFQMVVSI